MHGDVCDQLLLDVFGEELCLEDELEGVLTWREILLHHLHEKQNKTKKQKMRNKVDLLRQRVMTISVQEGWGGGLCYPYSVETDSFQLSLSKVGASLIFIRQVNSNCAHTGKSPISDSVNIHVTDAKVGST